MRSRSLSFAEVARLLSYTKTVELTEVPVEEDEGKWSIYEGAYLNPGTRSPFTVLYLTDGLTKPDVVALLKQRKLQTVFVVCSPSVAARPYMTLIKERARKFWTTPQYITSFFRQELESYRQRVQENYIPSFFVQPRFVRDDRDQSSNQNPIMSLLLPRDVGAGRDQRDGELAVLLAEPGQGKTYLSQYVVTSILRRAEQLIPLFVSAEQWRLMSFEELESPWKTILHTFKFCDSAIGWVEGCEKDFLRATLRSEIFRIVFDGFDEYVMKNRHASSPYEILRALVDLVEDTGARVLLTSRTAFWRANIETKDVRALIEEHGVKLYKLAPFKRSDAQKYFRQRIEVADHQVVATRLWTRLSELNQRLAGRGFVLPLIADLAENYDDDVVPGEASSLIWLMNALCERDVVRHDLPLESSEQLDILREFAAEISSGVPATRELLELSIRITRTKLTSGSIDECLKSFESHPLVEYVASLRKWRFREAQVQMVLLAEYVLAQDEARFRHFVGGLELTGGQQQDLVAMLIDLLSVLPEEESFERIRSLISGFSEPEGGSDWPVRLASTGRGLAGLLALMAVGRLLPIGKQRSERTDLLIRLIDGGAIRCINFSATLGSFDFQGTIFEYCIFDQVVWDNCKFNSDTIFRQCRFVGGQGPWRSEGFGKVTMEHCTLDPGADRWYQAARLADETKAYKRKDLRRDIDSVLRKFIGKKGFGLKAVAEGNLGRGVVSASKYRDDILSALKEFVVEEHFLSGGKEKGLNVRAEAEGAMRFYIDNNVLTGRLRVMEEALLDALPVERG